MLPFLWFMGCKNAHKKPSKESTLEDSIEKGDSVQKESTMDSSGTAKNIGIGPIEHVDVPDTINEEMAHKGEKIYKNNCSSCHKLKESLTGPPLAGVVEERSPEWVMNMILNTNEMIKRDPQASSMRGEYDTEMVELGLSEDEARQIVEYIRSL